MTIKSRPWEKIGGEELISGRLYFGKGIVRQAYKRADPDETRDSYKLVFPSGGLVTLAVTEDEQVILVTEFKDGVGRAMEWIGGGHAKEDEDELWQEAAKRELLEETGYEAGRMIHLHDGLPIAPGASPSVQNYFLALECRRVAEPAKGKEEIEVRTMPLDDFIQQVFRGEFQPHEQFTRNAIFMAMPLLGYRLTRPYAGLSEEAINLLSMPGMR